MTENDLDEDGSERQRQRNINKKNTQAVTRLIIFLFTKKWFWIVALIFMAYRIWLLY
jgi:hypothetical protein